MSENDELEINENTIKKVCSNPAILLKEVDKIFNQDEIEKYVSFLRTIANPIRMKILLILLNKEWACNCEFESVLEIHQTLVSHHLRKLRNKGLIVYKKHGQWKLYKLTNQARNWLEELIKIMKLIPSITIK